MPATTHPNRMTVSPGIHTDNPVNSPEEPMLDADFALETTRSIPFEADVLPDPKRLSPGNRLDVIASILAVAVLRSKVRKAVSSNNLEDIEESSGTTGEGLD